LSQLRHQVFWILIGVAILILMINAFLS